MEEISRECIHIELDTVECCLMIIKSDCLLVFYVRCTSDLCIYNIYVVLPFDCECNVFCNDWCLNSCYHQPRIKVVC